MPSELIQRRQSIENIDGQKAWAGMGKWGMGWPPPATGGKGSNPENILVKILHFG